MTTVSLRWATVAFAALMVHASSDALARTSSSAVQRRERARAVQARVAAIDALDELTRAGVERVLQVSLRWKSDNQWEAKLDDAVFAALSFRHWPNRYAILTLDVCPGSDLQLRDIDDTFIGARVEYGGVFDGARGRLARVSEARQRSFVFHTETRRWLYVVFDRSGAPSAADASPGRN